MQLRAGVGAAILRLVLPIAALAAIVALQDDHLPFLTLIRPGKEFLLLGGGRFKTSGDPNLLWLFLAYIPLGIGLASAPFFVIGRGYREKIEDGEGPEWLDKMIPPDKLVVAQRMIAKRGPVLAILGRLAAQSPALIGAAAGTSRTPMARFLIADAIGAVLAFIAFVAIGYALGAAYESAGPWLTGGAVVLLLIIIMLVSNWFQREAAAEAALDEKPTTD